jgi:hypothetical protein
MSSSGYHIAYMQGNWYPYNPPETRINLPIASLKLCCLAGSFKYNKPIFEDKTKCTLRGANKFVVNGLTFVYIKTGFTTKNELSNSFWSFNPTLNYLLSN